MGRSKKDIGETYEQKKERLQQAYEEASKEIYRRETTYDTHNRVAMANNMILHSACKLTMNELKLLRFVIMQTERNDEKLFEFEIDVKKLAKAIDISVNDLSRDLSRMTGHLMQEVIYIGDGVRKKWKQFHWVDVCEYDNGILYIKISDSLKPFLVGLSGCFTRYRLEEIVNLRSMYAIKIYEMLYALMDDENKPHADVAMEVSISIDELRRITDTTEKFERYSSFKLRVIDAALKEINEKSIYHVTATPYKRGKAVAGFDFLMESQAGYTVRTENEKNNDIEIQSDGQMNITDYQDNDGNITIT